VLHYNRVLPVVLLGLRLPVAWTPMLIYSKQLEEVWSCWQREIAASRFLHCNLYNTLKISCKIYAYFLS